MDILINDYINGEKSLCRDEAQFSVYLFQVMSGCRRVKIDSDNFTNKNYEVIQAYYMPAFLRDYFNYAESKAEFNYRLLTFANRKLRALYAGDEAEGAMIEEIDLSRTENLDIYNLDSDVDMENPGFDLGKHINGWSGEERVYRNPLARWMMNVRPDIAVLLKRRGIKRTELRMHWIDCHYLNGTDTYPAIMGRYDASGKLSGCKKIICTKQQIEQYALEFLCDTPSAEYADTIGMRWWGPAKESDTPLEASGVPIETGFVSMANFVSERNRQVYDENDKTISVQKLQEYNRAFYAEERKVKEPKAVMGSVLELQI
ncbi:MAG: hypothetical protein SO015_01865 [Wujia sp.]|nr:hypothetical protein [Wujia sp.]MCI6240550.1 hypothetical protein [Clostridium sp.]MDD7282665.1 hypothetical protein [Clostridium sp.]MDY3726880.1 hypothetical protein [Wujia sp.]